MGYARLKSISGKAFRSLAAPFRVEFPESGMLLFRGHNLDTGGSSGSGKTTLNLAISYLFGFCRYPATALQSWLTEEPMEVEGVVDVNEGRLVIVRGKKLALTLNGKAIPGSAKLLEERLQQLLGLNPELLAALTYRGQKQPGLFLSKTDAEKKEFLTTLLDLGKFERAIEESQAKVKSLETEVKAQQYVVERLTAQLASLEIKPAVLQDEAKLRKDLAEAQQCKELAQGALAQVRLSIKALEDAVEAGANRIEREGGKRVAELHKIADSLSECAPDFSGISTARFDTLNAECAEAISFLTQTEKEDEQRRREQKKQADRIGADLAQSQREAGGLPAAKMRAAQIQMDIVKLDASFCPTCDRQWDEAAKQKASLERELADLNVEIEKLGRTAASIACLQERYRAANQFTPNPDIAGLREIISKLNSECAQEKFAIEEQKRRLTVDIDREALAAEAAVTEAELAVAKAAQLFRANESEKIQKDYEREEKLARELELATANANALTAQLNRIQVDNAREQARAEQLLKSREGVATELAAANGKLVQAQTQYNAELDFQKLIGREGFLGAIFDEVLWEISDETNHLLAQFPNTAHVTLNFRSESTTQKGSIKKSIVPVVNVGGFEAPLSSGLSGGMETAVELAVDLAVATVVSRRTGAVPGWLVLDESFTGLGPVEAEASMEILRAFAEDRLVLVVDHASEFKSLFTQFVDVEYQGGFSRIKETK
jgi:DNA repair exonuclease SbcCD ATPase subunit